MVIDCPSNQRARDADGAATVVAHTRNTVTMATRVPSPSAVSAPAGLQKLDDRELRAWHGMLRVHATLTKALDAELDAAHGLPLSSYEVLMNLADADGERMRMSDLATMVILSRSGLTRLVDRLEREGLIGRESCPSDARGSFATLTAARPPRPPPPPPPGRPPARGRRPPAPPGGRALVVPGPLPRRGARAARRGV